MDSNLTRLTVLFEAPFWVGIFERIEGNTLSVCKVTFGAEPKDYEVLAYVLKNHSRLRFSPSVAAAIRPDAANPKRMQRQIRKQTAASTVGTRSQQALQLARLYGCRHALLKEKSPSCGSGLIYDGNFTGRLIPGQGMTAQLLQAAGIRVWGESQAAELARLLKEEEG